MIHSTNVSWIIQSSKIYIIYK